MRKVYFFVLFLTIFFISYSKAYAATSNKVFADYIPLFTPYGYPVCTSGTGAAAQAENLRKIESVKQEIRLAQGMGIDGFTILPAAWGKIPESQCAVDYLFQAADELNSGFKLFLGADFASGVNSETAIIDMIKRYVGRPSYFYFNSRPVVFTWSGGATTQDFWTGTNGVITLLRASKPSINISLMPYFTVPDASKDLGDPKLWFPPAWFSNPANASWVTGYNFFTGNGSPTNFVNRGQMLKTYVTGLNKFFVGGHTSTLFRIRTALNTQRVYYEQYGGEGIMQQWQSIINVQKPQWVVLQTWNDYTESYITPRNPYDADIVTPGDNYKIRDLLTPHIGYAEYLKYFISWYKNGLEPAITKDAIFYFYRNQPKNLVPSINDNNFVFHPDISQIQDEVYITTMLTAPATLRVTTGLTATNYSIPAGIKHSRFHFVPGVQRFQIFRNNSLIIDKVGEPVKASVTRYNVNPTSGYGYSGDISKNPLGDINQNGVVDINDFNLFKLQFGKTNSSGDLNYDGVVDIFDYNIFVSNYGK